jgi:hypothetical protein
MTFSELLQTGVTCFAHTLLRVCETIHVLCPSVGISLANGMIIFQKLPVAMEIFRKKAPDMPFPPTPVITCWGTGLDVIVCWSEKIFFYFIIYYT